MATRSSAESIAYLTTEDLSENTTKQSFKGIYPSATNSEVVDAVSLIGGLQTQTVTTFSRQDKYKLLAD